MNPHPKPDVPPDTATAPPGPPRSESERAHHDDERLDEELAETFPASDPIPYRHDS